MIKSKSIGQQFHSCRYWLIYYYLSKVCALYGKNAYTLYYNLRKQHKNKPTNHYWHSQICSALTKSSRLYFCNLILDNCLISFDYLGNKTIILLNEQRFVILITLRCSFVILLHILKDLNGNYRKHYRRWKDFFTYCNWPIKFIIYVNGCSEWTCLC